MNFRLPRIARKSSPSPIVKVREDDLPRPRGIALSRRLALNCLSPPYSGCSDPDYSFRPNTFDDLLLLPRRPLLAPPPPRRLFRPLFKTTPFGLSLRRLGALSLPQVMVLRPRPTGGDPPPPRPKDCTPLCTHTPPSGSFPVTLPTRTSAVVFWFALPPSNCPPFRVSSSRLILSRFNGNLSGRHLPPRPIAYITFSKGRIAGSPPPYF